jgi:hypothetical protein
MKKFRCYNITVCEYADNKNILSEGNFDEVRAEAGSYLCAKCGKTLEEVSGKQTGGGIPPIVKKIGIAVAASAILGMGAYAIFGKKTDPQKPPVEDSVGVKTDDKKVGLTSADSLDIYRQVKGKLGGGAVSDDRITVLLDSIRSKDKDLANKDEIIRILLGILKPKDTSGESEVIPTPVDSKIAIKTVADGFTLLSKKHYTDSQRETIVKQLRTFFASGVKLIINDKNGTSITNGRDINGLMNDLSSDARIYNFKIVKSETNSQGLISVITIQEQ